MAGVMSDATFGRRFLAALRTQLKSTIGWDYATVTALESADREAVIALFLDRRRPSDLDLPTRVLFQESSLRPAREAVLHAARTAEPEELAEAVATELRRLSDERQTAALKRHGLLFLLSPLFGGFLGD